MTDYVPSISVARWLGNILVDPGVGDRDFAVAAAMVASGGRTGSLLVKRKRVLESFATTSGELDTVIARLVTAGHLGRAEMIEERQAHAMLDRRPACRAGGRR